MTTKNKNFFKKIMILGSFMFVQGLFLFGFHNNQDFILNFKSSYLNKVYLPIYTNNISKLSVNNLANVLSAKNNKSAPYKQKYTIKKADSIPVLMYHRITDSADSQYNVTIDNFRDQMFLLKKNGWQTVNIYDFYKYMRGEIELPDKSFLLTFDDGARDSYYPVDPILKSLDYHAVSFVIPKYSIGEKSYNDYYLSERELKKMVKSGRWDIQSHGYDAHKINGVHFMSNRLFLKDKQRIETKDEFKERIKHDLLLSKTILQNHLGKEIIAYAYPFGDYGQHSKFIETKKIIADAVNESYKMSFYQSWNKMSQNFQRNKKNIDKENFFIKRISVDPKWKADELLTVLKNGRTKNTPYETDFKKDDGWIKKWGKVVIKDNKMFLSSKDKNKTSSAVILDGTYLLSDYIFSSEIKINNIGTFSLLGYYKDDDNFVECIYQDKVIKIKQVVNGHEEFLSETEGEFNINGRSVGARMSFAGDTVFCYLDDKIIVTGSNLAGELNHGAIGFKTWSPAGDDSNVEIKKVTINKKILLGKIVYKRF